MTLPPTNRRCSVTTADGNPCPISVLYLWAVDGEVRKICGTHAHQLRRQGKSLEPVGVNHSDGD